MFVAWIIGLILIFICCPRQVMARSIPGSSLTPTVWWDANAADNILAGENVTQLTDQSGNGNNAVVSGSTAPVLVANAVNGLSAMYFNGGSALISPTGASQGNVSHSLFVVAKYLPGVSSSFRCGAAFYSGSANAAGNSAIGVNPATGTEWIGGYGQDSAPYLGTTSLTNGQFAILAKIYDSTGPAYFGYFNSNVEVSATSGGTPYSLGSTDVGIGSQYDTGGYWGGDIAEVIMFNSALSTTDTLAVEKYLNAKYNTALSALSIQLIPGNQIQLSWAIPNTSVELQSSSNAGGPFNYSSLMTSNVGITNMAIDAIDSTAKFYRLQPMTNALPIPVISVLSDSDGATFQMNPGTMKLQVFSPGIVRVAYSLSNSIPPWSNSLSVIAPPVAGTWPVTVTATNVLLDTGVLEVRVNRASGAVAFYDTNGEPLLAEKTDGGKLLEPSAGGGVGTLQSEQQFEMLPGEAFYGLGQNVDGAVNHAFSSVHLQQINPGESAVPVLVSSAGYGLLWDNPAITDVNLGLGNTQIIPASQLYTTNGVAGGLNGNYYSGTNLNTFLFSRIDSQINFDWTSVPPTNTMSLDNYSVEWDGFIQSQQAGTYRLSVATDDGVRLWIDGQEVVNDWTSRAVTTYSVAFNWAANSRHSVRMQYYQNLYNAVAQLSWAAPADNPIVSWTSQAADSINYYFMYGPEPDNVVASYRHLTGDAPMFGKWAWGYWQSKEHYASQEELTNVVGRYRSNSIPIDAIVQDWYYWNPNPWGSHQFNTTNYPNVTQLMQDLHAANAHMIISVWGRFDQGTYSNYVQLNNSNVLYPQVIGGLDQYYDAFNSAGRTIYWQQINSELFSLGIDGWWLDASEPELSGNWGEYANYITAAGLAAKVFNGYPLMHTMGVYEGQRANNSSKRVFILTRSAYAGQQRNSAVTWSGDIQPTWSVFNTQIPAAVNFSISGIPYWSSDIGGFFPANPADPAYAELFTRWFQFGAFCPMFRVHGESPNGKEMWQFPPATENILINYDQLRYHLLPYIYSVAWMVTSKGYSMMRPLVMDFRNDTNTYNIPDQFMFGPSILVNPVMQAGATNRNVYLPDGTTWWDFWTGQSYAGGQTNVAAAPIETLPLYVRAGSILPYGPAIQYATQSTDPIELRVYRGANGSFTLYEDENDNYNYETGAYATIPITWNEATQILTIGQRQGSFPGMLSNRTFNIVWVSAGHGVGVALTTTADVSVPYSGQEMNISVAN